jgi:glycerol-3-phosphate dehydrogenase
VAVLDVAIIGAGVVGCALARELSRYRLRILLLEAREEPGFGVTKSNSGIVHAGHHASPATLKGRLEAEGNRLFDSLCGELGFPFKRIGELLVAQSEAELPELERLRLQGERKGVPGLEIWDRERLRREEPNLSTRLAGALHAPTAGVVNPYELAFSLVENAAVNGVELLCSTPVSAIEPIAGGLRLLTPRGDFPARFAVNCAGVAADEVAALLGLEDFRIRPRKGEEYMLDKRLQGLVRRLIFPVPTPSSKGILIIPTFDGTLMVGPTAEDTDDRSDTATTAEGAAKVFSSARRICPSITERDVIAEFAGLRPVSDTDDFVIGPTRVKGFFNAAGIQSPGLTAAPAIAKLLAQMLKDEGLPLEPSPDFKARNPAAPRFASLGHEERERLSARDPGYGRIACRCELVTEAEVEGAIDRGARTLDGIKFRTRAGMGRCQGGFCTTRCMEILSRRLGRPFHEATKRGGGSWIAASMEEPRP